MNLFLGRKTPIFDRLILFSQYFTHLHPLVGVELHGRSLEVQRCTARVMDENATDEAAHLNHEVEAEDPRQLRIITRQMDQELDCHQVLQPVSGNGAGRKGKGKIETCRNAKDRPTSITALKLIAKQGADEKAQLDEWKEDLMAKLTSEIV